MVEPLPERGLSSVVGALNLRRWAVSLLQSEVPLAPPQVGGFAWSIFLASERCGAVLKQRLGESAGRYPSLVRASARETQRVLVARAQLTWLSRLAASLGLRLLVLKGGVPVAEGCDTLDLEDLDLLARANDAHVLEAALERAGYRASGYRSAHSLRSRVAPGGVPIEIHLGVLHSGEIPSPAVWRAARPLRGVEGLWALAPTDHLWHVLLHCTVLHPERRGRLRDLLLISSGIGRCSPEEEVVLWQRAAGHPSSVVLLRALELARALSGRGGPRDDRFVEEAARRYVLAEWFLRYRLPGSLEDGVGVVLVNRLFGTRPPLPRTGLGESRFRHIAWLERQAPRLARVWRTLLQLAGGAAASAVAWPLGILLRGRAARALAAYQGAA